MNPYTGVDPPKSSSELEEHNFTNGAPRSCSRSVFICQRRLTVAAWTILSVLQRCTRPPVGLRANSRVKICENIRKYALALSLSVTYSRSALYLKIWSGHALGSRMRSLIMAAVRVGPAVYLRWSVENSYHVALRLDWITCWTMTACARYCCCLTSEGILK